jgi:hypothetical protein
MLDLVSANFSVQIIVLKAAIAQNAIDASRLVGSLQAVVDAMSPDEQREARGFLLKKIVAELTPRESPQPTRRPVDLPDWFRGTITGGRAGSDD